MTKKLNFWDKLSLLSGGVVAGIFLGSFIESYVGGIVVVFTQLVFLIIMVYTAYRGDL